MSDPGETSVRASRLKDVAFSLARDRGLGALSARSLSSAAGSSPSAVNYHFGNRDLLVSEICARTVEVAAAWRRDHQPGATGEAPPWAELDHAFTGMMQARLADRKGLVLLQELEQEAAGGAQGNIHPLIAAEVEAEAAFWRSLAVRHGAGPKAAETWANLALGLTCLMLSEPDAGRRSAWISSPASRLQRRANGRPVDLVVIDTPDAVAVGRAAPSHETALKVLDAALEIIAQKGADRLSQREVALNAGVSLASVTYFFRTKSGLIGAAFDELCRRHCATVADEYEGLDRELPEVLLVFSGDRTLFGMAATDALLRAAARSPSLMATAEDLRRTRGLTTEYLLRKCGFAVDRLDGYIWSCILAGCGRRVRLLPVEQRQERMALAARDMLEVMFPVATRPR
ncbi:MAG: helix-turn-helix domain-containing protein [Pseudomonadota bacterium]|uniref:helix-turn-helix domain-containing protein n=1 Tax=Phenylobacterium sp. TaxID=1871053 RepID=UPI0025FB131B|nr:helix-turn-helix domain-containing protein [Phenylobacterium sp.]MBT9472705.1 TetR/AcrR family transcriptional regulator [Phenylobacterium sp.]